MTIRTSLRRRQQQHTMTETNPNYLVQHMPIIIYNIFLFSFAIVPLYRCCCSTVTLTIHTSTVSTALAVAPLVPSSSSSWGIDDIVVAEKVKTWKRRYFQDPCIWKDRNHVLPLLDFKLVCRKLGVDFVRNIRSYVLASGDQYFVCITKRFFEIFHTS